MTTGAGGSSGSRRAWITALLGGVAGAVVGAIVAVNFVIFSGISGGYEASIGEVFDESVAAGAVTVAILGGFPLAGIWLGYRRSR